MILNFPVKYKKSVEQNKKPQFFFLLLFLFVLTFFMNALEFEWKKPLPSLSTIEFYHEIFILCLNQFYFEFSLIKFS